MHVYWQGDLWPQVCIRQTWVWHTHQCHTADVSRVQAEHRLGVCALQQRCNGWRSCGWVLQTLLLQGHSRWHSSSAKRRDLSMFSFISFCQHLVCVYFSYKPNLRCSMPNAVSVHYLLLFKCCKTAEVLGLLQVQLCAYSVSA